MRVSLTIIRYPDKFIPFALAAMAVFRLPLSLNKNIGFYKLMGCGKNGTFDKKPDLNQWVILAKHKPGFEENKTIFGSFVESWLKRFQCETYTLFLEPMEGHGTWDGKQVFGELGPRADYKGRVATLTRATIRISKLKYFWENVAPVAAKIADAEGFLMSVGIGEVPWIKQATFSVWESKESMLAFAYQMKEHRDVVKKTRAEKWYSEDMFVRFAITGSAGTLNGRDPMAEVQVT
jgi:hypothetical protein